MKNCLSVILVGILLSCTPSSRPIDYGNEECHYCKMTVVDKQHAAQAVTDKGKVYVYDAIECMINHVSSDNELQFELLFVNDYQSPGDLLNARESHYLISKNIPSPMGAFLSALPSREMASMLQDEYGGQVYDWTQVNEAILQND